MLVCCYKRYCTVVARVALSVMVDPSCSAIPFISMVRRYNKRVHPPFNEKGSVEREAARESIVVCKIRQILLQSISIFKALKKKIGYTAQLPISNDAMEVI